MEDLSPISFELFPTTSQGGLLRVLERLDEFMGLVAEARRYCSALVPHG